MTWLVQGDLLKHNTDRFLGLSQVDARRRKISYVVILDPISGSRCDGRSIRRGVEYTREISGACARARALTRPYCTRVPANKLSASVLVSASRAGMSWHDDGLQCVGLRPPLSRFTDGNITNIETARPTGSRDSRRKLERAGRDDGRSQIPCGEYCRVDVAATTVSVSLVCDQRKQTARARVY